MGEPLRLCWLDESPSDGGPLRAVLAEPGRRTIRLEATDSVPTVIRGLADGSLDAVLLAPRVWGTYGRDALDRIRRSVPAAPVIVVLDQADRAEVEEASRRGAGAVLALEAVTRAGLEDALEAAAQGPAAGPLPSRTVVHRAGEVFCFEGLLWDMTHWQLARDAEGHYRNIYQAVVEDQIDLICRYRPDGRLAFVNAAFGCFFGGTARELVGQGFYDLLRSEDRRVAKQQSALLRPDRPTVRFEVRGPARDGAACWIQWQVRGVFDAQGHLLECQAVGRDITRLHQAREAVGRREAIIEAVAFAADQFFSRPPMSRHIQEFLRRLGEAADASRTYLFKKHAGPAGQAVVSQLYEWCAPGIAPQVDNPELQNMPWDPTRPNGTAAMLMGNHVLHGPITQLPEDERHFLAARDIISMAMVPILIDGAYWGHVGFDECVSQRRWTPSEIDALRAAANIIAAAIQREHHENALRRAHDELEHRVAERTAELRDSELTARAILASSTEVICLLAPDGTLLSINEEGAKRTGIPMEQMVGRNLREFFPPEVASRRVAMLQRVVRTGKPVRFQDERAGRHFDHSYSPVFDANGRVTRVAAFVRDVTTERELERRLIEVSAREQRRIGSDLHDGLCQQLAGIALMTQSQYDKCMAECRHDPEGLQQIARLLEDALNQARDLSRGLQPVAAEREGLMMALEQLAQNTEALYDVRCRFVPADSVPVDDPTMATHLYRIAQEAVNNAVKHSGGQEIEIRLEPADGRIHLRVTDNGGGWRPPGEVSGGMGLDIMHYRARIIGGELEVCARPEGGTRVHCSVAVPCPGP